MNNNTIDSTLVETESIESIMPIPSDQIALPKLHESVRISNKVFHKSDFTEQTISLTSDTPEKVPLLQGDDTIKDTRKIWLTRSIINNAMTGTINTHDLTDKREPKIIAVHYVDFNREDNPRCAHFYMDSGCYHHAVNDRSLLDEFVLPCPSHPMGRIMGCTGMDSAKIMGYGTIQSLGKVLYVPDLHANLISVAQLTKSGFKVTMNGSYCEANMIVDDQYVVIEGNRTVDGQYSVTLCVRYRYDICSARVQSLNEARTALSNGICYMMIADTRSSIPTLLPLSSTSHILSDPISDNNELVIDSGCSQHMFNTCRPLTNFVRFASYKKNVMVANGSTVPVIGQGECGILRTVYYVPALSHNLISVNALTYDGIDVIFSDDYAIITTGNSGILFDPIRARKSQSLYKISMIQFELCTKIPHVYCLAHPAIGDEAIECNLISDSARLDPISMVHYSFGHPSAERTRHICKCLNLPGIRKLETKAFEFLKKRETHSLGR
jgi:hypothetical protein